MATQPDLHQNDRLQKHRTRHSSSALASGNPAAISSDQSLCTSWVFPQTDGCLADRIYLPAALT
eukprot:1947687-Rhodomonas_salina.1